MYQLVLVVAYWQKPQKLWVAPLLDFEVVDRYKLKVTVGEIDETVDLKDDNHFRARLARFVENDQRLIGFCLSAMVLDEIAPVQVCSIEIVRGEQAETAQRQRFELLGRMVEFLKSTRRMPSLTPSELEFPRPRTSRKPLRQS